MMKNTILLCTLLTVLAASVAAQTTTYYVLGVHGNILNKSTNQALAPRQTVKADDLISFSKQSNWAMLYSTKAGLLQLLPKQGIGQVIMLKKSIFAQRNWITTRTGLVHSLQDLQAYIASKNYDNKHQTHAIVDNRLKIPVTSSFITQISKNLGKGLFFIRYQYEGKNRNIALSFKNNHLIISKEGLFKTKDGQWLDPKKAKGMYMAFYRQKELVSGGTTQPKGVVHLGKDGNHLKPNLKFVSEQEWKELGAYVLVDLLKKEKVKEQKIITSLLSLLYFYGTGHYENMETWYKNNFK